MEGKKVRDITGHLTFPLLAVALLSSFGSSMLYGYNLAVVNSPSEHIKLFYNATWYHRFGEPLTQRPLTLMYSLTVSVFAIGGMLGSLLVGVLVSRFGRKGTVVNSAPLVFLAGGLMGFSRILESPEMIMVGRFITGIHSGISLSVVPMYLGEIAPKNLRGFLGLFPSIFICLGVFTAQVLGLPELLGKDADWPLFLSLVVVPTFIQLLLLPWFPESPRYLLIEKNNAHAAIAALRMFLGQYDVEDLMEEMKEEQNSLSSVDSVSVYQLLSDRSVRWQVIYVVVINMGMQLSGIDAIWFYTNSIFENAGIPLAEIPYTTVGTGAIEVLAGFLGCFTIERLGRRPLMISGFAFMGICCAGITLALVLQDKAPWMRYVSVACVIGIIAGFCIGPERINTSGQQTRQTSAITFREWCQSSVYYSFIVWFIHCIYCHYLFPFLSLPFLFILLWYMFSFLLVVFYFVYAYLLPRGSCCTVRLASKRHFSVPRGRAVSGTPQWQA